MKIDSEKLKLFCKDVKELEYFDMPDLDAYFDDFIDSYAYTMNLYKTSEKSCLNHFENCASENLENLKLHLIGMIISEIVDIYVGYIEQENCK